MININPDSYKSNNVVSEEEAVRKVEELKKQGKKVGLCTGSFDILHPGHITHLISAKKLCDVLIVGIARDKYSSSKYPSSGRPVFSDNIRAFMISKLKPVDFVFLEDGVPETVAKIKPNFYIKGSDYVNDKDPRLKLQREMVESYGGKIEFTKDEKLSTTDIVKHIKEKISVD